MFATYNSRYPSSVDNQRVEIIGPINAKLYRIRFLTTGLDAYAERDELSEFRDWAFPTQPTYDAAFERTNMMNAMSLE